MSLWNQTAADLLSSTASAQPTPGGGSIAAVSGAFGAGLVAMAVRVSLQKAEKKGEERPKLTETLPHLDAIQGELKALADEDVAVFGQYMVALKLSKGTPERAEALAQASEAARQTPLHIAQHCAAALAHAEAVLDEIDAGILSDVGAGASLLRGALDAALLTLDINLRSLKGEALEDWQRQRREPALKGKERAERVLERMG